MTKYKALTAISIALLLGLMLIQITTVQASDEMSTFFSKDYAGISIEVNATQEAVPEEYIAISIWINCTAAGVNIDDLTLSIYGFRFGREKILLNSTSFMEKFSPVFNHTSEYSYTVSIPNDVWGVAEAELYLKYTIVDSPFEQCPHFNLTIIRNVYLEELENKLKSLNSTYWQINQTFWDYFQMNLTEENLALLNKTYRESQGSQSELGNTRTAVAVLAITTVFFVATTVYLVMRKPKQY